MSQCGDYEDIHFYVINVFYGIVIAVYFLLFKKKSPCRAAIDVLGYVFAKKKTQK